MSINPDFPKSWQSAIDIIRRNNGVIRTTEGLKAGIHPRTLYSLKNNGILDQLSRGVYRLAELPPVSEPDLVTVALRVPQGVICLISALAFHGITTQIPHEVDLAVPRGAETPRIDFPPIAVHRFSGEAFGLGIEMRDIDGVQVQIYSPEKTLADCFKFRNKLGMAVVLEALKLYRARKTFNIDEIVKCARACRVRKIMDPYLEALI